MEKRIIIAGSGGQGILFFGKLLAHAAMFEGREVTWFPSYGAEMRGGTAHCTVIISDHMIASPVICSPDILVAMNAASLNRFLGKLPAGGSLFYDSSTMNAEIPRDDITVVKTPACGIASSLNAPKSANVALLGAFIAATGVPAPSSVLRAAEELTPLHRRDLLTANKTIFMKGFDSYQEKKSLTFPPKRGILAFRSSGCSCRETAKT